MKTGGWGGSWVVLDRPEERISHRDPRGVPSKTRRRCAGSGYFSADEKDRVRFDLGGHKAPLLGAKVQSYFSPPVRAMAAREAAEPPDSDRPDLGQYTT